MLVVLTTTGLIRYNLKRKFALSYLYLSAAESRAGKGQCRMVKARPAEYRQASFNPTLLGLSMFTLLLVVAPIAFAQTTVPMDVSGSDIAAASAFSNFRYHILPAKTNAGAAALASHGFGTAPPSLPSVPSPGFYPDDLTFFGGAVVRSLENHNVYVDCALPNGGCWGNPAKFLGDLSDSTFIHLTDQYVHTTATNRYPVGTAMSTSFALFTNTVGQSDLLSFVHAAAKRLGVGYGHIYHVFLPRGVDTCFDLTSMCYSPDSIPTFAFCAYHGSVTFSDIGHVLFSVEPFQNVPGCQAAPPNPNGILADSTNSVLSHELIESITDPDPSSGWVANSSLLAMGAEIGDLCEPIGNAKLQFLDPVVSLNGHPYELQAEYSNKFHACATVP